MSQIVDNYDIFKFFVRNDSQILNEESIVSLHAIFSMHNSKDGFFFLIKVVNNGLSVILGTCSEHIHVEDFAHGLKELKAVGPDIELELIALVSELDISLLTGEHRVNKRLIQIQN